ncbi:flagellar hook-length control protein FliK [Stenotrophomonas maltophilia]|uniref:flagellar hook-length control protein FliK n=1 Tax=Stenotrophomonas maltophilia TaxID=40324 RepID=UPI0019D4A73D|nr:flagellar hook-length control protein FliK [Stenotrophomonas maltophilia]MBN7831678.1 flagellar hook-length control protein FliK [Stenotrophomonas maltophilia]MBN7833428.1 flagellar hook-length control protein FliK [Stenotrophomonas maltophilia]MBN7859094.1 flagellar hook-length control protein FliK [Stenotrophomonas maltophilia]MBN7916269.1 flagellar hook-length control protein FliK [Stenotrophomonas maltophilia]MBO2846274.1 flagellar hook-length control protein FliK [Stenotrophomonas malt
MPAPLASSANTATPATSNSAARASRSEGGKDFSQLLQGGAPCAPASAGNATTPTPSTPSPPSTADSNGQAPDERNAGAEAATAETPSLPPVAVTPAGPGTEKDKPAATEDAPWPPPGLAGLVLAMPMPADPAAALPTTAAPALASDGSALPAAAPATNPTLPADAPATATTTPVAADAKPAATSADDATALPLPEMILPGKRSERGEGSDVAAVGDRASTPLLHAPAAAAVQDLKAALAAGNAIFNGEPTPKPVLGDDGFDQAIGARLGWLADQKIGHAHIRLSPDDMGPVDVRLQLNGDKVHASFSSPHVDVRQALESSLPRLRELLGEQGFQLAHADVGHQSPGGDGNAPGQPGGSGIIGDGEPTPGDASVSSAQLIRQRGLLDAYA